MEKNTTPGSTSKIVTSLESLSMAERAELLSWVETVMAIRHSDATNKSKLISVIKLMKESKPLLPVVTLLWKKLKKHGWAERQEGTKWFLGTSAIAIFFLGLQGVGIAAFGGAIGLPLWLVFGAGGPLLYAIKQELQPKRDTTEAENPHSKAIDRKDIA